jgi:poly-gamma-glutamate synthesis protein (capsule biosynthesis protein)
MLARRVQRDSLAADDITYSFGNMPGVMKQMDLFFCNLECQISDAGFKMDKAQKTPFYFRADPRMAQALSATGIDVVNLANNHAMDYGPDALLETIELCRDNGVVTFGAGKDHKDAASAAFVNAAGLKVAFIGFHSGTTRMLAGPYTPGINSIRYQESEHFLAAAQAALARTRDKADLVAFSIHWGPNFRTEPTDKQRRLARAIIDMGYDVFVAHSAHQFLGVEVHNGKPIIHDAGDFVVDFQPVQGRWHDRNLIFVLHYDRKQLLKIEAIPIYLQGTQTNLAEGTMARSICDRFQNMCQDLGTQTEITSDNRVIIKVNRN